MVLPKNRSSKYRKVSRKTPKGTKKVYLLRRTSSSTCPVCKSSLFGVKTKGSRTEKSVSRLFGGHLCSDCSEAVVKESVRVKEKFKNLDEVDFRYKKYVQQLVS